MTHNSISLETVGDHIIGNDLFFSTPFGKRLMTYADYTASGRTLNFIEKYLLEVQRSYANTHTEDDYSGGFMTHLLAQAEKIIKVAFNADHNCYVIPSGTGTTGAIAKLQEILGIYVPPALRSKLMSLVEGFKQQNNEYIDSIKEIQGFIDDKKPVVFISPYEHHSNDIMWREGFCDVVEINLSNDHGLDLKDLEQKVSDPKYSHRTKIGSFSAASNVTGLISPVYDIARILHKHSAIACFDYAASAPYVKIDMNRDAESYFDAIFLSPHKFLGGPGSCGILVINDRLYNPELSPTLAAGGTVDYVSSTAYDFIENVESREKAGTPGILQVIKAALAISLKDAIGIDEIESKEKEYTKRAFAKFSKNPNIEILGSLDPEKRIPIFSILIKHQDKYLHPRLGSRLLNDLFGIQSRAGCSCAGPYGHRLLSIGNSKSKEYRCAIASGCNSIKPGWLRVNFHYAMNEDAFHFICDAIDFIATYGHFFIPLYVLNQKSGLWTHIDLKESKTPPRFDFKQIIEDSETKIVTKKSFVQKQEYDKYLHEAELLVNKLKTKNNEFVSLPNPEEDSLRYFYVKNFT